MNDAIVTVEDAAARFDELVEHVHAQREATVIVKAGRPLVRMVPIPAPGQVPNDLIEFLRRWRSEYPEADDPLAESIRESRRGVRPPHDPWE